MNQQLEKQLALREGQLLTNIQADNEPNDCIGDLKEFDTDTTSGATNHRPNKHANAVLQWDHDRYLHGGQHGQSPRGQHVLILKDDIDPGVEITVDYGPTFSYEAHGFSRHQESRPGSPQGTRRRVHFKESPRVRPIPSRRDLASGRPRFAHLPGAAVFDPADLPDLRRAPTRGPCAAAGALCRRSGDGMGCHRA